MYKNILIVYYSHSGNSEKIANLIQQETGGTICEIQLEKAYPASYNAVVEQAKNEIKAGFMPPLKNIVANIKTYDTIFVGSPNWWSTIAPPIATFLTENNMSGKTIIPFCTHGGGGLAQIAKDIAKLCPHSTILRAFQVYGNGNAKTRTEIASWLLNIGLKD